MVIKMDYATFRKKAYELGFVKTRINQEHNKHGVPVAGTGQLAFSLRNDFTMTYQEIKKMGFAAALEKMKNETDEKISTEKLIQLEILEAKLLDDNYKEGKA